MRDYLPPNRAILRVYAILEGVAHSPGNSLQNIQNCLYPKGERDATTDGDRSKTELAWSRNGDRTRGKTKSCVVSSTPGTNHTSHIGIQAKDSTDTYESAQNRTSELFGWPAHSLHRLQPAALRDFLRLAASYPSVITQVSIATYQLHRIKKDGAIGLSINMRASTIMGVKLKMRIQPAKVIKSVSLANKVGV